MRPFTVAFAICLALGSACGTRSEVRQTEAPPIQVTAVLKVADIGSEACQAAHDKLGASLPDVDLVALVALDALDALDAATGLATLAFDPAKTSAAAIAATISAVGCATTVAPAGTPGPTPPATGVDPVMAAACEMSCAAPHDCDLAAVVPQPGAKVGDLARCPVSGVVFKILSGQPRLEVDGRTWFTCCGGCMEKIHVDPHHFIRG